MMQEDSVLFAAGRTTLPHAGAAAVSSAAAAGLPEQEVELLEALREARQALATARYADFLLEDALTLAGAAAHASEQEAMME